MKIVSLNSLSGLIGLTMIASSSFADVIKSPPPPCFPFGLETEENEVPVTEVLTAAAEFTWLGITSIDPGFDSSYVAFSEFIGTANHIAGVSMVVQAGKPTEYHLAGWTGGDVITGGSVLVITPDVSNPYNSGFKLVKNKILNSQQLPGTLLSESARLTIASFLNVARITLQNRNVAIGAPTKQFLKIARHITRVTISKNEAEQFVFQFYGNNEVSQNESAVLSVTRIVKSVWPETIEYAVAFTDLSDKEN